VTTRPLGPLAGDPEGRAATHGSEDPEGAYPEDLQNTTLSSLGYKSSQHSLSLLLTTTRRHSRLRNPSDTELP
ncbi:hypothetical protein Taro_027846, partial [Colocasia esculenta]|nr:hypothetical protein [Colocasia esculenta]